MTKRGCYAVATGSIELELHYKWEPRYGSTASAHWHIVSTRKGSAFKKSGGREPLDGICCEQAVGDLEDWGWPREEALGVGRAIAEMALTDWIALEPHRLQAIPTPSDVDATARCDHDQDPHCTNPDTARAPDAQVET